MLLETDTLPTLVARTEAELARLLPEAQRSEVSAAMRTAVLAPGKRLRPLLVLLTGEALGAPLSAGLLHAACAVEFVHAASLVLDDLPCMDDARLRRGQPAVHVAHGQAVALLATVGLLASSVQVLMRAPGMTDDQRCRMAAVLHDAIGPDGLVLGQARDLRSEFGSDVDDLKTGALFAAALQMGAIASHRADRLEALRGAGLQLGRVFQLRDDLDDLDEDAARFGLRAHAAAEVDTAARHCVASLHDALGGACRLAQVVEAYFCRHRIPVTAQRAAAGVPIGAAAARA